MSIELSRDYVQAQLRQALREKMPVWVAKRADIPAELSEMMMELLFDVAATTKIRGTRQGIIAGVNMVRNWNAK